MSLSRREFIAASAGVVVVLSAGSASALTDETLAQIREFAGGEPTEGGVAISAPEIAENGNTVPVDVSIDAAPEDVEAITILADGNPNPDVVTFYFTALSGAAAAGTRIRLATTQNVVAVARLRDGAAVMAVREVKVTIGGCGG